VVGSICFLCTYSSPGVGNLSLVGSKTKSARYGGPY